MLRIALVTMVALAGCIADDGIADSRHGATDGAALEWVGDTHVRVATTWLPPSIQPAADRDLEVYTQTYPIGAATEVILHWSDGGGTSGSAAMMLDADGVGPTGNNRQWRGRVPAASVVDGRALHYWIEARDGVGGVRWDSRDGANYQVTPRRYDVGWIGGFGAYRPVNGEYQPGQLFNGDESTSTGCWNHGVSASSYRTRAARVWIPGLSDRDWNGAEMAAIAAMVRVELYTDARGSDSGWSASAASLVRREGNDFLYSFRFVDFTPVCVPGLGDGTFGFKLRASMTDGNEWLWRGAPDGADLRVQYAARCSYFNDPYDCIPTETDLSRAISYGPGGSVQRWDATPIGTTSTFTRDLGGIEQDSVVSDIALTGPDADQFQLEVFDPDAGEYVDPAGPFEFSTAHALRLIVVHAPTLASPGVLPQQATVSWTEQRQFGQPFAVDGVYLRGRTAL
jgi:hypothetical protein